MKKEDFYDSKWDARDWTEEQKIQWQEKCFELGFSWQGKVKIHGIDSEYYWLDSDNFLYLDSNDYEYFLTERCEEKHYEDMFPEQPEEKLDVVAEIVKLVHEAQGVEEEEEDSFDGLVYVAPEVSSYIFVPNLSDEQKNFLDNNLDWADSDRLRLSDYKILNFGTGNSKWCLSFVTGGRAKSSFNNIFQYKEV